MSWSFRVLWTGAPLPAAAAEEIISSESSTAESRAALLFFIAASASVARDQCVFMCGSADGRG